MVGLTSSVDEVHKFLAEVSGVGVPAQTLHDQVGGGVREVLVEAQQHIDEGVWQLVLHIFLWGALDLLHQEQHVVLVPLI